MKGNKLYIIGGLILIVAILVTILITKSVTEDDDIIKALETRNKELVYEKYILEKERDSLSISRKKNIKITDSLTKAIIDTEARATLFYKELNKVKGKYRGYSSDSLYKELIKEYKSDTGNSIK